MSNFGVKSQSNCRRHFWRSCFEALMSKMPSITSVERTPTSLRSNRRHYCWETLLRSIKVKFLGQNPVKLQMSLLEKSFWGFNVKNAKHYFRVENSDLTEVTSATSLLETPLRSTRVSLGPTSTSTLDENWDAICVICVILVKNADVIVGERYFAPDLSFRGENSGLKKLNILPQKN